MKKSLVDFGKIKKIPIKEVANELGLRYKEIGKKNGGSILGVWDAEKNEISSLTLFEESNSFYRFSSQEKGDVIDLVKHVRGCTMKEALNFFTSTFPKLV
jgi:hypothetical protein